MIFLFLEPRIVTDVPRLSTEYGEMLCWKPHYHAPDQDAITPQWLQKCEGAVQAINVALQRAMQQKEDIVIIGRDCTPTMQAFAEMTAFAMSGNADPMIMFAAPRDPSGQVTGLPLPLAVQPGAEVRLAKALPRHSYVPRLFPSCVLVKTAFLKEIGVLDEDYVAWSAAVDDLCLRANAFGFRAITLNHVFVSSSTPVHVPEDEKLLAERYPEAGQMMQQFATSARRTAESQICRLLASERRVIAFDFSYFSTGHDGTNEAGLALLRAALSVWVGIDIAVIASKEVWEAHRLCDIPTLTRLEPGTLAIRAFAIIRMGQPWRLEELPSIFHCAPIVAFFMLDAIGYDCQYNAVQVPGLDDLWSFVAIFADCVFTQSLFTLKRLEERLHFDDRCLRVVTHHSLDVADYGQPRFEAGQHILVVGNHFRHKFITPTVDALAPRFPDRTFVAVGYKGTCYWQNVTCVNSGKLTDEEFFGLYDQAQCVIYPSIYEGFGFPIMHALARGKVVYARQSSLYDELLPHTLHGKNVRQFTDTHDLVRMLAKPDAYTFIPDAPESEQAMHCDVKGWERSASEVLAALNQCAQTADFERIVERDRWCATFGKNGYSKED